MAAPSSSLAAQLQHLREQGAGSKRKNDSFLYDAREAARIDDETVYNLAWNGLLELKSLDAKMARFDPSRDAGKLFARERLHFHRVQLTKADDVALDTALRGLLDALSPYFLLGATHKVLEFLVRRYEIHRYNVDDVMAMILSYHESPWFARMVRLLHIHDTRWEFLLQVKQTGEPLLRSALVQRARDESSVIEFIFDAATRIGARNPKLISLYALVVIQMMEQTPVNEAMLRWLLPELLTALKTKHFPEAHAAAYMIVTTLASKAVLNKPVVETLVQHLVKCAHKAGSGTAPMNALLCVIYVAQTQPEFCVTARIAKHVLAMENLIEMLSDVANTYESAKFMRELTAFMVDNIRNCDDDAYQRILIDMVASVGALEHVAENLVEKLLRVAAGHEYNVEDDHVKAVSAVLTAVARKYADQTDAQVQSILAGNSLDPSAKTHFDGFLELTFGHIANSARFLPANTDAATSLVLALESPNEHTRFQALQTLEKQHKTAIADNSSERVLTTPGVLFRRLCDESPRIVQFVATSSLSDLLFELSSKKKVFDVLVQVIHTWATRNEQAVIVALMDMLVGKFRNAFSHELDDQILVVNLSLIRNDKHAPTVEQVWQWISKLSHPFASALQESTEQSGELEVMLERFGKALVAGHLKLLHVCLGWSEPSNVNPYPLTSIVIPVLKFARQVLREKQSKTKVYKDQCTTLDSALRTLVTKDFKRLCDDDLSHEVEVTERANLLCEVACDLYPASLEEFDACLLPLLEAPVRVFVQVQSVLAEVFDTRHELEDQLLATMGRLLVRSSSQEDDNVLSKVRVLDIISVVLGDDLEENEETKTLMAVIVSLGNPSKQVREAALNCLKSWFESVGSSDASHGLLGLVRFVTQARSDIIMDPRAVANLCGSYCKQDSEDATRFGEMALGVVLQSSESDFEFVAQLLSVLSEVHRIDLWINADSFLIKVLAGLSITDAAPVTAIKQQVAKHLVSHFLCDWINDEDSLGAKTVSTLSRVLGILLDCTHRERLALMSDVQCFVLARLTPRFFSTLDDASQYVTVNNMLMLLMNADEAVISKLPQCWKALPLSSSMFVRFLSDEMKSIEKVVSKRHAKKTRNGDDDMNTGEFQRLTCILEVLTVKVDELGDIALLKTLGDLLQFLCSDACSDYASEYLWQVIFECLRRVCQRYSESGDSVDSSVLANLEPEGMVRQTLGCMERTISPQTRNQALLFVSALVHVAPASVLKSLDKILGFLSQGAVQREDDHSLNVLETIVQAVVPHIMNAKHSGDRGISCQHFVRIFVNSLDKIPSQRRLSLFKLLVQSLGFDYLPYVVSAVIERQVYSTKQNDYSMDFAHELCFAFGADIQVSALVTLLRFARDLHAYVVDESETDTDDMDDDEDEETFRLEEKYEWNQQVSETQQCARSLNLALVKFIPAHLKARELHHEIIREQEKLEDAVDDAGYSNHADELQEQYLVLAQLVLLYFQRVAREQYSTEQIAGESDSAVSSFWSDLAQQSIEILSSLQQLLSTPGFVALISELLHHDNSLVRKKAMQLFNERLQDDQQLLSPGEELLFVDMVDELDHMLRNDDGNENSNNIQTALLSIDILARRFAAQHTKKFEKIVPTIVKYVKLDLSKAGSSELSPMALHLLGCAYVSLSSICRAIGPLVLPFLPKFFPNLLNAITFCCDRVIKKASGGTGIQTVLQCLLASLQVFTDRIPQFLTPYLSKIVNVLLTSSRLSADAQSSAMFVDACFVNLTNHVELRHLLPHLVGNYDAALSLGDSVMERLFSVISTVVTALHSADLRQFLPQFARFFVTSLDLRRVHAVKLVNVDAVEDNVLEVFVQFILRLSEKQMKPLFLQLCEWPQRLSKRKHDTIARETVFFKLLIKLSENLKSIFVPYYAHVFEMLGSVLHTCSRSLTQRAKTSMNGRGSDEEDDFFAQDDAEVAAPSRKKRRLQHHQNGTSSVSVEDQEEFQLLQLAVQALNGCFEHDADGFMDKDKFEMIMSPLVDVVDVLQTKLDAQEFVYEDVSDCIANLAWAAKSDLLWKPLHYAVLMKSRGDSAAVRLATLKILDKCYTVVGDEFLAMLPESIPFLAELMEDNDAAVEETCHQVIKHIEEISGEPLDQYLTS